MFSITVVLDATDTPKTIRALAALATAIPATSTRRNTKLANNIVMFTVYPESGNNVGAVGPARLGFDASILRDATAANCHGDPLLPGIRTDYAPAGGGAAVYNFDTTWLTGQSGDVFQIDYDHI
jgi:hypothetical protein